ncbi:hypothetical protein NDA01_16325 [Trichocoleus desertorum AS-A10]|uniref:hypothetical protein n=1 Tax=Trichocoleus desertorum TaxID=1481672 RepID=UPI00329A474C
MQSIKKLNLPLEAAQIVKDEDERVKILIALANKLPQNLLPIALEATQAIKDDFSRAQALTVLASKLPEVLPKALEAAQAIKDDFSRAQALAALALHLVNASNCFNVWKSLMHFLSYRTRPNLLSDIAALNLVISALGDEAAITETAQAIQDVTKW